MLTSDAKKPTIEFLLAHLDECDTLTFPHHGERGAEAGSLPALIALVKLRRVISQSGPRTDYGHPSLESVLVMVESPRLDEVVSHQVSCFVLESYATNPQELWVKMAGSAFRDQLQCPPPGIVNAQTV